jgi:inositol oxygenase
LIVEDNDGVLYIQSTRQSMYHCQPDEGGRFRLLPRKIESKVVVWSVVSTTEELFLDADLCTFDLYFSRNPTFWEICDDDKFGLVKSVESPGWRSYYQRLWSTQTVSFIESMHREFLGFNTITMSILEALMLAKEYPADPFSGTGLSVRTMSFAAAEHARNEGQPDWIQFVALIRGLACAVKSTTRVPQDGAFDWTILDVESRVVGCKATACGAFAEYQRLNPDKNDERYNTHLGMCKPGEGLEHVLLSWTSSEYMYHMMKHNKVSLPGEGYKILKLSPLVDWHSRGKYQELSTIGDEKVKQSVADFHWLYHRAMLSTLKDGKDLSDKSCLSMWHSHYAMIVRKYTGTIKKMAW